MTNPSEQFPTGVVGLCGGGGSFFLFYSSPHLTEKASLLFPHAGE